MRRALIVPILAGLLIAALPAQAHAAGYSVLQINMCNSGYAGCYSGRARTATGDLVNARRPSVATLNEACSADMRDLQRRTGYVSVFTPSGTQRCKNGSPYGNALLLSPGTRVSSIGRRTYLAQDGGAEKRTLTCARGPITACVTHLSLVRQTEQAAEMRTVLGQYAAKGPTVLGGDWNIKYPGAQRYVPAGMFRKGDGDVQHIMATKGFGFVSTRSMKLNWTDHPGWQVYLKR